MLRRKFWYIINFPVTFGFTDFVIKFLKEIQMLCLLHFLVARLILDLGCHEQKKNNFRSSIDVKKIAIAKFY